ncbi:MULTISPECIES: hypothetical protein [unclassified Bradyrhizobium]|uniref:hypothetical protein n=1 Tax=unclassified Bradyrhizobium TaxID=2631580 RepID=UPI0029168A73|nr:MULTISPECIES: hypothetical protein [unclassified Bradyrhizobium]
MIGRNEYSGQNIKTPEGKRIYKAGIAKDGAYQLRASKAKTEKERDRLLTQGRKALRDALAKAIASEPAS